jgi:NAD dependent epimerase/dehydratase family enzyme
MGSDASLALMSSRCRPQRFQERGFQFAFNHLDAALHDLCGRTAEPQG